MRLRHKPEKCKAENPATCRYHGQKQKPVTKADLFKAKTPEEFRKVEALLLQQHIDSIPRVELGTTVKLDGQFHLDESKGNGEWQQGWLKDESGFPVAFVKIHDTVHKDGEGNVIFKGIVLCDMEVNPAMRGANASLAVFRTLKQHFNVEQIWCGSTFSAKGLKMYNRLRGHELATGETTLKLEKYYREDELRDSADEYNFVENWDTLEPKYRL